MPIAMGTITGHLGADGDLKKTQNGQNVVNFRVGTTTGWGDAAQDLWVRCALWGSRAEALAPHLTKGRMVFVTGELSLEQWEKDGKHGASICIRVNDIDLAPSKNKE